jgi:DNA-binding response OmpR family regulator
MLLEDVEQDDKHDLKRDLRRMNRAGQQLLKLINDILDPAKIAADAEVDIQAYADNIHFQLRNPLNVVMGYGEILQERCTAVGATDIVADLKRIDEASLRLLELIDDLVSYTQLARGQTEIALQDEPGQAYLTMAADLVSTMRLIEARAADTPGLTGHLLVVDDIQENLLIMRRRLQRQGHTVTVAHHGREALDLLRGEPLIPYDVVLLDIMMPELNGYRVLEIMQADKTLRHIPVIVLSALDDARGILHAIEMGAQDYLTKPYNPALLKARIEATLEKKRLRDRELAYLQHVEALTSAAAAVESGSLDPEALGQLTQRTDELGRLARVFQNMVYEVQAREARLMQKVQELRIQINRQQEEDKVTAIIETDYFQQLQQKAHTLRDSFRDI